MTNWKQWHVSKSDRLTYGTGSSGCQPKWVKDGYYIKLSLLGYEHVSEVLVSHFLSACDLGGFKYLKYELCEIYEDGIYRGQGCYSKSFISIGDTEVTASDIITRTASSYAISYDDAIDLFYDFTKLYCKNYINTILAIDSIVKNDDRHFRNISFILQSDGSYDYSPFYDFGAGLLSDIFTHPMTMPVTECLKYLYAKPFSVRFGADIVDFIPIRIDMSCIDELDRVLVGNPYVERAMRVLHTGLSETENRLWERL